MYCVEIWGNTHKTRINCISVIQRKVMRIITGINRSDPTNAVFVKFGVLKFVDLIEQRTAIVTVYA